MGGNDVHLELEWKEGPVIVTSSTLPDPIQRDTVLDALFRTCN